MMIVVRFSPKSHHLRIHLRRVAKALSLQDKVDNDSSGARGLPHNVLAGRGSRVPGNTGSGVNVV
jgi:hypothetical protein